MRDGMLAQTYLKSTLGTNHSKQASASAHHENAHSQQHLRIDRCRLGMVLRRLALRAGQAFERRSLSAQRPTALRW